MNNVWLASRNPRIGIVDANRTLEGLIKALDKEVTLDTDVLESCLYYSNLLNEIDAFKSPSGEGFETFLLRTLPQGFKFNKKLNFIYKDE
jgi:hypothetical protein